MIDIEVYTKSYCRNGRNLFPCQQHLICEEIFFQRYPVKLEFIDEYHVFFYRIQLSLSSLTAITLLVVCINESISTM